MTSVLTLNPSFPPFCFLQPAPLPAFSIAASRCSNACPSERRRPVHRRQRIRATIPSSPEDGEQPPSSDDPPAPSSSETDDTEAVSSTDETDVSDLSLPNLNEFFKVSGREGCEQCAGSGEISCPVCNAQGFVSFTMMDTTSSTQCRLCRGQRVIPCPTCREVVYKAVLWWDKIPSEEEDPDEKWRDGPDGPKMPWTPPPAGPSR